MRLGAAAAGIALLWAGSAAAQPLAGPFVIDPSDTGFTVIWETAEEGAPAFQWTVDVPQVGAVESEDLGDRWRHRGQVVGVSPGDVVTYRADGPERPVRVLSADRARIAFISDAQLDAADPFKWEEVAAEILAVHRADALHALVVAGDAVDEPGEVSQFDDFLGMAEELLAEVPLLAVPGNDHGAVDYLELELPWRVDAGPVTLLGLDSRVEARTEDQRQWIDAQLDCEGWTVATMHHPFGAELFTPDNNGWSQSAASTLLRCADTAAVFGAAHGYWRGEDWTVRQLLFGAGSAGGPLDLWGTEPQAESEAAGISRPEYGFLLLDAAGDEAVWERHTLGAGVTDSVVLRGDDAAPAAPGTPTWDGTFFVTTSEADYAAEWEVRACGDSSATRRRVRAREEYGGEVSNLDLTRFAIEGFCAEVRVRQRSQALVWSDWSEWSQPSDGAEPTPEVADCDCQVGGGGWLLMGLVLCRRRR